MVLYDSIGKKYNQSRKPDLRIVDRLINLLDLPTGSLIADLGAGTGNYSNALAERGYRVIAIEPSLIMQNQAIPHQNVSWLTACAEEIPLPDNFVDGAVAILSLHHFRDRSIAIREINRIIGDENLVIFTFSSDRIPSFWLTDYFPYFLEEMKDVSIDIESIVKEVESIAHKKV
jgi:ubiquinone/menaquinone biosynthesis C-methylase UbiE